ncbi:MAG: nitroreductase family protein [Spirochaetota bacterium]
MITLDTIMGRRSVRSYSGQALSPDQLILLESALADEGGRCPFGNSLRFRLAGPGLVQKSMAGVNGSNEVNVSDEVYGSKGDESAVFKIGTYGVIKNPPAFIIGAVAAGPDAVLDYGYALEGIILAATAAGLGTCWLGGSFDRKATKDLLSLKDGEIVPAITPVGLPAEKRSLTERTMRYFAGSDSRKPWNQLFFDGQPGRPLDKATAGEWAPVLEAVRLGPSASNKQPWRVLREGPSRFSLLFAEDKAYNSALGIPIQELDIGIAMKHFELAAEACGLSGSWIRDISGKSGTVGMLGGSLAYIASWDAEAHALG